jgi:transposase
LKIDILDIDATLGKARQLLDEEKDLSPALRSSMEVLLLLVSLLLNRVTLNSKNSSKPPSSDPNRKKMPCKPSKKPSGGQKGHVGKTLQKIDDPDEIAVISIDRRTLPKGQYKEVGFETRQVFDIDISRLVTEYQAQVLENTQGKRFTAPFPKGVTKAVQYGNQLKAHAVYLSQYQLLPYKRIQEYFTDQLHMPLSEGSLYNFNQQAYTQLAGFEQTSKDHLAQADVDHADETGININGKRHWLHCTSNNAWTHYFPHQKRGKEAMDEINILPRFQGILCHDHWKPYYRYAFVHALCNAHHLRELTRAWEQDKQQWAREMETLLREINQAVDQAGGSLNPDKAGEFRKRYRLLLKKAEGECPPPKKPAGKPKRGRLKRSKARNLLERLVNYEDDVLRFMENPLVPFTNNRGENDIRMTKVQQKISGCFRSMTGAKMFCRIRGYLSTCRKQGLSATDAMGMVFKGELPGFSQNDGLR